ncbi:enoyl-CoA hydratase/isomerase family protein [Pseudoclavibacter chungangensis]|uniref:3-hydroxyisobutyryl-CoA hydrolase n=1 Tax=Pseudoclavibacter chungangensis TaxID=587635 RepID=A0A7J5BNY3_9MICO|nr:enoyl-CoA hydratase/isomerase family protein [Pseudoclavibacter chungangensis]
MGDAHVDSEVRFEVQGRLGVIVLDRPRVINALSHEMVNRIHAQLVAWADDDAIERVALTGAGERGLCAGGDVVVLYEDATSGDGSETASFLADEYRLDAYIARYPKPYVSLMDGIVLGGGVGLSAHAAHRLVTERSRVGMPETQIGFVTDVGGTWLLGRAPGELGVHAGLTGTLLGPGEAIALGFADVLVPSQRLPELLERLETEDVASVLGALAEAAPDAPLLDERPWIDAVYDADDIAVILERLDELDSDAARDAATALRGRSPSALAVTLRAIRIARGFERLEDALAQEYRVCRRLHAAPDFAEGVRAQVVDKDKTPRWHPATVAELDPAWLDGVFEVGDDELRFDIGPGTSGIITGEHDDGDEGARE